MVLSWSQLLLSVSFESMVMAFAFAGHSGVLASR